MEATQYQKFNLICKEIIDLAVVLDRVRKACQEESSFELRGIKRTIEQSLDYQPIKGFACVKTQQLQDYDDDYLQKQQQQQQQKRVLIKQKVRFYELIHSNRKCEEYSFLGIDGEIRVSFD